MAKRKGRIQRLEKQGVLAPTHAIRPFADPVIQRVPAGGIEKEPAAGFGDRIGVLQGFGGEIDVLEHVPQCDYVEKTGKTELPVPRLDSLPVQFDAEFPLGKLPENPLWFNAMYRSPRFGQKMGKQPGTGADIEAVGSGQGKIAFDKAQVFFELLFVGREPTFYIVPCLSVKGQRRSTQGLARHAVQVVDEVKSARRACVDRCPSQFIGWTSAVSCAQFASAEIVHALLSLSSGQKMDVRERLSITFKRFYFLRSITSLTVLRNSVGEQGFEMKPHPSFVVPSLFMQSAG